jgi:D-beta-D-heptose 7-phosphate kinase/D-beta-D-heptose 1-phosphate adenosyltransferase
MTKKILVIGDSCIDEFVYCSANRLCPDIPVPVLNVSHRTENPGMSMNLVRNIKSLGYECDSMTQKNWKQVTKTRYMHLESNHMFVRIDKNQEKIKRIVASKAIKQLDRYELIAISDYDKGFLTNSDIEIICWNHPNVFIDTKKKIGEYLSKAKFIKINTPEYKASELFINSDKDISNKIIRTCGGEGAYYQGKNFPTKKVEVRDVSGAGDSFFAGLICEYYKSENIEKAIKFANKCASKVVQQKGVTTIN